MDPKRNDPNQKPPGQNPGGDKPKTNGFFALLVELLIALAVSGIFIIPDIDATIPRTSTRT